MIDVLIFLFMALLAIFSIFGFLILIEYLRYFKRKKVLKLNLRLRQESNLTDLSFNSPEQLELLSQILDTFSNENVFYKFFSKEYRTYFLDLQSKVDFILTGDSEND